MSNGKYRTTKPIVNEDGKKVTPVTGRPAAARVHAPPCPSCKSNDTLITSTRGTLRYFKCVRCGFPGKFSGFVNGVPFTVHDILELREFKARVNL